MTFDFYFIKEFIDSILYKVLLSNSNFRFCFFIEEKNGLDERLAGEGRDVLVCRSSKLLGVF